MGRHGSDSGFLHESPLEETCWRCYIWNKIIVDSWSLPIQCCVLVSSPIQDLHSFLHSLEVQTDPVLSVWLQVFFCSRQLSPQAARQRISSSLETSSCVRGYSFPSVEVNTPKHIIGPIMTIRCIKTRRTTQWSGLSACGAVCLDWGCLPGDLVMKFHVEECVANTETVVTAVLFIRLLPKWSILTEQDWWSSPSEIPEVARWLFSDSAGGWLGAIIKLLFYFCQWSRDWQIWND